MCGIVGYIGNRQAAPLLLDGLSKLEYRGYDSAGISVRNYQNKIEVVKAKGRLKVLAEKIDDGQAILGTTGIGHTRWATHGEPSECNAHPHVSNDGSVVAVHNGIIENYQELKDKLVKAGYMFYSQTDTEVAVNLIDYYSKKYGKGPVDSICRAMIRIRGSYALAVMFLNDSEAIYTARKDSPLIIGCNEDESFIASDVPAILKHTNRVYYIGNMEIAKVEAGRVAFFNIDREPIEKELTIIEWDAQAAEKGGFEHFMMKEIHEQPTAARDTLNHFITEEGINLSDLSEKLQNLDGIEQIYFVACGSAYHVSCTAQYAIESLTGIPVRVDVASEFRYRKPLLKPTDLVVVISQSGETADSLAALRLAKDQGVPTLAIVNVIGSSIAREADDVLYTIAGPEIAVATTKAYSTQLIVCYILAVAWAYAKGRIDEEKVKELTDELMTLPDKMQRILEDKERIQWFAAKFASAKDAFFIGRGIDYATAMEGSLKMKEISYVHSEAYAAGELKHGTISLIEDGVLTVGVLTQPDLYEKTLSNMVEVKSRGGYLMGLTTYGHYNIEDTADFVVYIPKTNPLFATSLAILPLQLMGYYVSVAKGLDVDKPRNLAKSVTVE
ncbi:MAG: glutamine--fructose-6-phosphate transaminase (isomerizing) [Erysipelotrichaceae bacterium]|nr:glutamine--fructose-6-phosphate transaminase (isomerizing) [Erysipelotrichaceae bacterium]